MREVTGTKPLQVHIYPTPDWKLKKHCSRLRARDV